MKEVDKFVESNKQSELIIQYLTDSLGDSEREQFEKLISTNQAFRRELSLSMAAMAIAGSVAGNMI